MSVKTLTLSSSGARTGTLSIVRVPPSSVGCVCVRRGGNKLWNISLLEIAVLGLQKTFVSSFSNVNYANQMHFERRSGCVSQTV